jgi:hypothetical protein
MRVVTGGSGDLQAAIAREALRRSRPRDVPVRGRVAYTALHYDAMGADAGVLWCIALLAVVVGSA